MQCFGFGHGVGNIVDTDYFDLKCFFPAEEAVYSDSILERFAAGRTCHSLGGLFKT